MPYTFIDGYGSVQSANSSVTAGSVQTPIINVASILTPLNITLTGNPSISGTVNLGGGQASVSGLGIFNVQGNQASTAALNQNPVVVGGKNLDGSVVAGRFARDGDFVTQLHSSVVSLVDNVSNQIAIPVGVDDAGFTANPVVNYMFDGTTWDRVRGNATNGLLIYGSIASLSPASVSGVGVFDTNNVGSGSIITVWTTPSIVGTYSEDAGHTSADKGLFTLGVRNDAVASFASANLEYSPKAVDSAGRTLTKPFAPDQAAVRGTASTVGTSVTAVLPVSGTGLRNYITDIIAVNTGATTAAVNLRDSDASILTRIIVPTGGGSNIPGLATPLRTGSLNSQVDMVPLTASSLITITLLGYVAP